MPQTAILKIKNLSIDFITSQNTLSRVIDNINIEINKGEIVAIVGESGSGKSVTSLAILQLLPKQKVQYSSGEILFNYQNENINLLGLNKEVLTKIRGKKIAMIFQEPMTSLNPLITCGNQVLEAIMLHKKINKTAAIQQVLKLFEKVKLPNPSAIFKRYPHQLSGGQKQRVMIAMAICCEPDLLICDEPTTALDVTVQKNILLLIKELQQENNMSVIFISHDLGVVAEIADKIVVLYKGKIIEKNTTQQLLHFPQEAYTKALLACRPALYKKGERLPVVANFLNENLSTISLKNNSDTNEIILPLQTLIELQNVKVYFTTKRNFLGKELANFKAVDDVSFKIYKGETLGLVGESGCGKTTLGRAILQIVETTSGTILYKNFSKEIQTKEFRKKMQLIFQDPYSSLNPSILIGEAIAEPLMLHNIAINKTKAKETVIHLLEKVGLHTNDYKKYPHEFSGGQRQRIVIARALALQPEFIVCDESVSALDVSVQAQVLNLLNDLKNEFKFTALFISHDLSVVKYLSDRIIVMKNGKIEEIGNAEQIFANPQSNYTQQLISAIPVVA
ncbi:MAG: ABC transporter ATP-binding protein [Chitinophagaceae bacterium]|nr:ABC transporter ATP-binding protein [Chitinophagaceae bacterium]